MLASDKIEFEKAIFYRNRINALSSIQSKQPINCKTIDEADIIAIFAKGNYAVIQVFFVRNSYILGNTEYFPKNVEGISSSEILEFFLTNFYESKPLPKNIIISENIENTDVLENALEEISGNKTEILYPQKGEKKALIEMALKNAELSLDKKLAEEENAISVLKKIQTIFGIEREIKRIDVFDNSHLFGKSAVAGVISAGFDEENKWGFLKKNYRRFNVDSGEKETGGDDFYMMKQALAKRYGKIEDENEIPELILIDGGAGQLSASLEVIKEIGLQEKTTLVGIAKGEDRNAGNEEFFMENREAFRLEKNSAELYFLQNLRDEAHRFAITSHRNKRKKTLVGSRLDEIEDIGSKRKKALLQYFGSVRAIEGASIDDLKKVEGVSNSLAERIYSFFRG
ncbi:MAG: excinuclease ABC subunit UvrC [Rickettsiales bacterium]|nr:excinuclease ABC subunit UvrC [Rickettsiales bacterium]